MTAEPSPAPAAHAAAFEAVLAEAARDPAARAGLERVRRAWTGHEVQLFGTAAEVAAAAPQFFARLEAAATPCRGVVLEIGASLGQVTRWIAAEEGVTRVFAVERDPAALAVLRALDLPKTTVAAELDLDPARLPRIDTLVLCELIEHLNTRDEMTILARYAARLTPATRFVISTPVGFLEDPDHVRGFTKTQFLEHVEGLYGPVETVDYRSGYSQVAVGRLANLGRPYRG